MIRDLKGTIEREKAAIGLFVTLEEPSREMELEATTAGLLHLADLGQGLPADPDPHHPRAARGAQEADAAAPPHAHLPAGRAHTDQEGRGTTGDVRLEVGVLHSLFRYAKSVDAEALENFTTEALASAIRQDHAPLVNVLRERGLLSTDHDPEQLDVHTQRPRTRCGHHRPGGGITRRWVDQGVLA